MAVRQGPLLKHIQMGLPNLSSRNAKRVEVDNKACAYVLQEIQRLHGRGGGSVRENPAR